jgi:hypothetical protein
VARSTLACAQPLNIGPDGAGRIPDWSVRERSLIHAGALG